MRKSVGPVVQAINEAQNDWDKRLKRHAIAGRCLIGLFALNAILAGVSTCNKLREAQEKPNTENVKAPALQPEIK